MTARERRWLVLIFGAVLPASSDARFPRGASDLGVEGYIAHLLSTAPRDFRVGLRICTWVLMLAPPLVLGRMASFAGLAQPERTELLERLSRSNIYLVRELPMLFKTAVCLGLCGLAEVQRPIGIHPVDATPPDWASAQPEP